MSNSVIQRELTALVHEKNYFHFLRHQCILITGATGLNYLYLPMRLMTWI